jgi:hypothetical protein
VVPDDSGSNIANLPNLVVFGRTIHPQHVLMLVAACAFFGLKGLVVGGILCESRLGWFPCLQLIILRWARRQQLLAWHCSGMWPQAADNS